MSLRMETFPPFATGQSDYKCLFVQELRGIFLQLPLRSLKQIQGNRLLSYKVRTQPLIVWSADFPVALRPDISANKIFIANVKGIFASSLSRFFSSKIYSLHFLLPSLTVRHPVEKKATPPNW